MLNTHPSLHHLGPAQSTGSEAPTARSDSGSGEHWQVVTSPRQAKGQQGASREDDKQQGPGPKAPAVVQPVVPAPSAAQVEAASSADDIDDLADVDAEEAGGEGGDTDVDENWGEWD